jgi:wyosine [tRNA(Phe)-imidazoG37] synthetase (radical SAM superfamily)
MSGTENLVAFGPVPSRRLGRSVGINNIPPKVCTYACVYCQLGRTLAMRSGRFAFYAPDDIAATVRQRVNAAREASEDIDYLTFVPDGEPTLDANLGRVIDLLRPLDIPIAVITNSSQIWRRDVQSDLMLADWVSVKVDAVQEDTWRRIDRPHGSLRLTRIQEGLLAFAAAYGGILVSETMLVQDLNDRPEHLTAIAGFLQQLRPARAYIAVPTRPPAKPWVRPPDTRVLNMAYQMIRAGLDDVELLTGYEGDAFAYTGDAVQELLSIMAVHPMRHEALIDYVARAGSDWSLVEDLLARKWLIEADYGGHRFYLRNLQRGSAP